MEVLDSPPGYLPQAGLSAGLPQTPPYTPYTPRRTKHRLDGSDSPASIASSVHPTETTSPPKKVLESPAGRHLIVEELAEGDHDGNAGDIIGPNEVEEVPSDAPDDELDEPTDHDPSPDLPSELEHLDLGDTDTTEFDRKHRDRRYSRRYIAHHGKRSRSPSRHYFIFGDCTSPQHQPTHNRSPDNSDERRKKRIRELGDFEAAEDGRPSSSEPRKLAPAAELNERRDGQSIRSRCLRIPTVSNDYAMETDSD